MDSPVCVERVLGVDRMENHHEFRVLSVMERPCIKEEKASTCQEVSYYCIYCTNVKRSIYD